MNHINPKDLADSLSSKKGLSNKDRKHLSTCPKCQDVLLDASHWPQTIEPLALQKPTSKTLQRVQARIDGLGPRDPKAISTLKKFLKENIQAYPTFAPVLEANNTASLGMHRGRGDHSGAMRFETEPFSLVLSSVASSDEENFSLVGQVVPRNEEQWDGGSALAAWGNHRELAEIGPTGRFTLPRLTGTSVDVAIAAAQHLVLLGTILLQDGQTS